MKEFLTNAFASAVRRLPVRWRERMFKALARDLGVESFVVAGKLGRFEGSVDDRMIHESYLQHRTWSPALQDILANVFRKSEGTFVDAGANIGLTTIPLARRTNVECHAFEPEPRNNAFLRRNVVANEVEGRVRVYGFALSDADGELAFELSPDNMGDHRVRASAPGAPAGNRYDEHLRATTRVPGRRLDGLLDASKLPRPLAMKIDVQGFEIRVLRGAKEFLPRLDALVVEFWPYGLRRAGDAPEELIELVRGFPYAAAFSDAETAIQLHPTERVLEKMRALAADADDPGWLDIVFSRTATL